MFCPKGFELEEAHDIALRVYLEALAAAKMAPAKEALSRDASEKAAALQSLYDQLSAHINECPACQEKPNDRCRRTQA
jgi:hypothetical protein